MYNHYNVSMITVSVKGEIHILAHIRFLDWPDHGVPRDYQPFLDLLSEARLFIGDGKAGGVPIVHCSAGVGRTGVFVTCYIIEEMIRSPEYFFGVDRFTFETIPVKNIIKHLREHRNATVVQTMDQYVFVYSALEEMLQILIASSSEQDSY